MKTIYIRTNLVNGKQYVGQTEDFKRRERDWRKIHTPYSNKQINEDRVKYGLDSWTVDILDVVDETISDEKEREYIKKYNTLFPNGYNKYTGGIKDFTFEVSDTTKIKISKANKGKTITDETKKKISDGLINHPQKSKLVYQYTLDGELVNIWPSAREAARQLNCSQMNISVCCNGGFYRKGKWVNRHNYRGYRWSYVPL